MEEKIPWRRKKLPTPVFLSGEFHGLYSPWGHKELDTTGRLSFSVGFPGGSDGKKINKICLQCKRPQFNSWVGKIQWRKDRLPTPVFLGFPGSSAGKESAHNSGDLGSIPGLGGSPGEGKGYPHRYSGLQNSMDCLVPGVAES